MLKSCIISHSQTNEVTGLSGESARPGKLVVHLLDDADMICQFASQVSFLCIAV
jgi:hypothetical protein